LGERIRGETSASVPVSAVIRDRILIMKILKILTLPLIIMTLSACSSKPSGCITGSGADALKSMVISKAEVHAAHAYSSGDHKLIGIHSGVGLMVPGLAGNPDSTPYKINTVEVDDVSCSVEEHEIKSNFVKYAYIYNRKMISMLKY
jgi:hypothetical protein